MTQKIAILSDIHSNLTALEAVADDLSHRDVMEVWLIGDLLMYGSGAHDLLALIGSLHPTVSVRGNWDDLFLATADGTLRWRKQMDIYVATLGIFLYEHLTAADVAYIRTLPMTARRELDSLTFQMSHNLPHINYGHTLLPAGHQTDFDALLDGDGNGADVAIYGHVHHQLMRVSSHEQLILNPGSVGQPFQNWQGFAHDLRAQYLLLELDETGIASLQCRKVAYDVDKEVARARQVGLPYADLYEETLRHGRVHTHDEAFLRAYHSKTDYEVRAREFLDERRRHGN